MTKKLVHPQMYVGKSVKRLPPDFYSYIGRLAFEWGRVESLMVLAAKRMLGISIKAARVAMRTPRPTDVLEMIEQLAYLHKEDLGDVAALRRALDKLDRNRNLILHAKWVGAQLEDKSIAYFVQQTTGSGSADGGRFHRRVYPEGVLIDTEWFEGEIRRAEECLALCGVLAVRTMVLSKARRERPDSLVE